MKRLVKETSTYLPGKDVNKIIDEIENERFENKNFIQRDPLFNEDDEIIIFSDNYEELKTELKNEILKQGYKSISDFAKKNQGKYKEGTIKMNLAENNRHSETVIAYITKKLGFKFNKKIIYELKK